jgi:next-to-BRCA1 protein 1
METLLTSFRKDIDRIMLNTFGECNASVDTSHRQTHFVGGIANETPHASSEALGNTIDVSTAPPSSCFVCRNEFSGTWYGCVKCPWHYIVRFSFSNEIY